MIWIYWEQGSVPDSLAAAFHVFAGSEAIFWGAGYSFWEYPARLFLLSARLEVNLF